jgi:SAM-dependent methyltransferase
MSQLNPDFWKLHFDQGNTPWDRGQCSPQLIRWLNSDLNPCRIAIPGCGKGWEVAALSAKGFEAIGIDYTQEAVEAARKHLQNLSLNAAVIKADVLTYQPDELFDAVYEQTCLCALTPDQWVGYALQLARWLKPGGDLYALFMQVERPGSKAGLVQGPPFHCDITGMRALFHSGYWTWSNEPPVVVTNPNRGWHEIAIQIKRNSVLVTT